MVVPLVAAAIAAPLASGLINYWGNEKASRRSAAERAQAEALLSKVQAPDFDPSQLTQEEFKLVGSFNPKLAEMILPAAPQLVQGNGADAVAGGNAERDALSSYLAMANNGGEDAISRAANAKVLRDSDAQAQSSRATLDQSMQRRGFAPSGALAYGAALQSGGDAAQRAALAGQEAAAQGQQRRMQALGQAASIGGSIRDRDVNMESKNVASTNAFNQMVANLQNENVRYNTGVQNDAQRYNLGNAQQNANANTNLKNDTRRYNRDDVYRRRQQDFQNRQGIATNQANIKIGNAGQIMQNAAQTAQSVQGMGQGISTGALYGASMMSKPAAAAPGQTYDIAGDPDELMKRQRKGYA